VINLPGGIPVAHKQAARHDWHWKCNVRSIIQLHQSMHIYSKNIPAKFYPDPIWNDRALGFYKNVLPIQKNNRMSSDMGLVPDPKISRLKFNI